MKILVTGSRRGTNGLVWRVLVGLCDAGVCNRDRVTLVTGGGHGADREAQEWLGKVGTYRDYPVPDWRVGRYAGPQRNSRMIEAEHRPESPIHLCLAFPDKDSRGTWDCVRKAVAAGIVTHIHPVERDD